jgi:hypothetical protein
MNVLCVESHVHIGELPIVKKLLCRRVGRIVVTWKRVPVLFQLRIGQHILYGGVCVYCFSREIVNTFSQEACPYIIPAENFSINSLGRLVHVLFQRRISQKFFWVASVKMNSSVCRWLLTHFFWPERTQQPDFTLREGPKSITTYLTTAVPTASVLCSQIRRMIMVSDYDM